MNKEQKKNLEKLGEALQKVCDYVEREEKIENWLQDYTTCFNLCNEEVEQHVYEKIIEVFDKQITIQKNRLLKFQGENLMREYLKEFRYCTTSRTVIWRITCYLERFWIPSQKDALKIRDLALVRWRKTCYLMAADTVRGSILDLIDASRNKEAADKSLIKQFIESLQQLSLELGAEFYKEQFEKPFIQRLKQYYGRESKEYFSTHPIAEYMAKAEERIREEEGMAGSFFLESTKPLVVEALNESLISDHFDALQRTFEGMLREHNEGEMKTFYFLLSRLPDGLSGSAKTFEGYLLKEVLTPVIKTQYTAKQKAQIEGLDKFCQDFIAIKRKYTKLIEDCFLKNVLFQEAMDKAFSSALNAPNETYVGKPKKGTKGKQVKPAKVFKVDRLLAMFVDNLFKGKKDLKFAVEEIEAFFGDVVKIVAYFTSRDVFFECSKRHLCQRLLSTKRNEDLEASFLNKLKAQFGQNMVRHLQGMLNDVAGEGKENLQKEFEEYLQKNKIGKDDQIDGVAFTARLLKESHWPVFPEDKIQLQLFSQPMEKCRSTFEKFYKESKSERRVRWLFNHGEVEVDTQFKPQEKKSTKKTTTKKTTKSKAKSSIKLTVSPFQSQLLCLFNQKKEWTPSEMCQVLFPTGAQIKEEELLASLFSALSPLIFDPKGPIGLVLTEEDKKKQEESKEEKEKKEEPKEGEKPKKKSTKKKEAGLEERDLTKDDKFFLKTEIQSTLLRIQYATESAKRQKSNQGTIDKYVRKKREFMLDAAMVRVMKARNAIKWTQFQTEVLKLVQKEWTPSAKEMKKRLGSLMERDFIKRSENDENLLQYIA
jgi:hypothetical protein